MTLFLYLCRYLRGLRVAGDGRSDSAALGLQEAQGHAAKDNAILYGSIDESECRSPTKRWCSTHGRKFG